ncbi:TPA: hypothetical protein ACUAER_004682 [Escherichia coli]|nr:hypothetical protein [Escherichia coli]EFC1874065.1 hypothetical protein [Escherichia coli]HDS2279495.1 hypothetical protein [Escherichia coli]
MTKITKFRISEIIARIEMYGHGAGYTADEVLELAQIALATCKDGESIKLIDLLVQELPKRGGWPDDVLDCRMVREDYCEPSYGFFAFGSDPAKSPRGRNFCLEVRLPISNLDREEYTEIISRKQYEEALEASNKLNFEQWLGQQREKIDLDCGCVSTETFMHWLRVAYESGNRLDTHPQEVPKPRVSTTLERSYLEIALKIKAGHTLGVIDAMLVHEMAKALLPLIADQHEASHANEN